MNFMTCPDCGGQLKEKTAGDIPLVCCPHCSGVCIRKQDLLKLTTKLPIDRRTKHNDTLNINGQTKPDIEILKNCPLCRQPMRRYEYAFDSRIIISRCQPCNSLWLSKGQLFEIDDYIGLSNLKAAQNHTSFNPGSSDVTDNPLLGFAAEIGLDAIGAIILSIFD